MRPEFFRVDLVFDPDSPAGESSLNDFFLEQPEKIKVNLRVVLYRQESFEKLRKEIEDLILAKNPLVTLPGSIKTSEEWAKQFSQILLRIGELQNKDDIKAKEDQLHVFLGIQNGETDQNRNRPQSDDTDILLRSSDQSQELMGERNRND
ncbi:MAG: hypothetical protein UBAL2_80490422 [Leptospirillum rubarum]|nr:MAG: hypothetical protein UBAL2_80490422 [Leptospirillum rubarum]